MPAVTVMTYNVGNGLAPPWRLAELLRQKPADVIGLQELAAAQADALVETLGSIYPYQVLRPVGFAGKGLLSRYPVVAQEELSLYPDRPDLRATLEIDGLRLNVLVAHPPPPRLRRGRIEFDALAVSQLRILPVLALEHTPSVLLGDFNMTPRNPTYEWYLASGLQDAFAEAGTGRGWTLPKRLGYASAFNHRMHRLPLYPLTRVDYIWSTPGTRAEAAWVGADAGSDHLPVLARLALRPEAAD